MKEKNLFRFGSLYFSHSIFISSHKFNMKKYITAAVTYYVMLISWDFYWTSSEWSEMLRRNKKRTKQKKWNKNEEFVCVTIIVSLKPFCPITLENTLTHTSTPTDSHHQPRIIINTINRQHHHHKMRRGDLAYIYMVTVSITTRANKRKRERRKWQWEYYQTIFKSSWFIIWDSY